MTCSLCIYVSFVQFLFCITFGNFRLCGRIKLTNPIKWLNTVKQFVGNCLSVFYHFVGFALKELRLADAAFEMQLSFHGGGSWWGLFFCSKTDFIKLIHVNTKHIFLFFQISRNKVSSKVTYLWNKRDWLICFTFLSVSWGVKHNKLEQQHCRTSNTF